MTTIALKKTIATVAILAMTKFAFSQTNVFPASGNVGIGTANPQYPLEVNGAFMAGSNGNKFFYNGAADVIFQYAGRGSGGRAMVHGPGNTLALNFGGDFSGGLILGNEVFVSNDGGLRIPDGKAFKASYFETNDYSTMTFMSRAWQTVQGANGKAFSFMTHNNQGGGGQEMMSIYYGESGKIVMGHNGGNVLIGKESQSNPAYKLDINGKVRANEIVVNTSGADFVFEPNYQLKPLSEIESFVRQHKHLPGISTAAEMQKEGVGISELQTQLLQKVEELTLHLIRQEKEIKQLKKQLKKK